MSGDSVVFDELLEQCCDQHRRIVLAVLAGEQRPLTIKDLTKSIIEHNHHLTVPDVPGETLTRIQVRLHHLHVPKLERGGLVDYDPERRVVEPTARFDAVLPEVLPILEADPELGGPIEL